MVRQTGTNEESGVPRLAAIVIELSNILYLKLKGFKKKAEHDNSLFPPILDIWERIMKVSGPIFRPSCIQSTGSQLATYINHIKDL